MMPELIVDQSDWHAIRVDGDDRARFLHGLCTANIESLADGDWVRACILTVKARVVSVIEVINRGDNLLVLCEPAVGDKTLATLEKHAIMDDVDFTSESLSIYRIWHSVAEVWSIPPTFGALPGPASPPKDVEALQIAAGLPRYGVDVSEDNFPFESPLEQTIDYEKGCYIGQEPVYRVHAKGAPSRFLRGLRIVEGDLPAPGTPLSHPEKPDAGSVTSSIISDSHGPIALAYLHRKAGEPDSTVTFDGGRAIVAQLPLATTAS